MAPKLSRLPMALAMVSPMLTKPKVTSNIMGMQIKKMMGSNATPSNEPSAKTIMPWIRASVLSPNILPRNSVNRETGETRISFMKPNSLSQITDMPMNIDVKSRVCPMMPGKMYCW